uniref:Plastocyanin-like domain-containing protein n=1 Tax=Chromera velia CCMP2878 TaxID=1169474 RepID=A0A0G4FK77_9ALVE|eukprot:Cvel_3446.t1-p1 / transcript=Cvel_3446.t1 / gene=Cvel_3446 / organism=Chromera_velia_CCMP2878 / gene_product=Copper resistance protein A homolog, putative / transcript_product=Copper resistance protein A homolog, putative / location=Cvel_scaffold138:117032-123462(+) / protein_length=617 / sequence_SO=supercontig / SO=protein_coding / is_pseudo=false
MRLALLFWCLTSGCVVVASDKGRRDLQYFPPKKVHGFARLNVVEEKNPMPKSNDTEWESLRRAMYVDGIVLPEDETKTTGSAPSWRNMDGINGLYVDGTSVEEGDPLFFSVILRNHMEEATMLHWHGLTPPMNEDGVPMLTSLPLESGSEILYDFSVPQRGLYWMHSHYGLQLHYGLAAPVVLQHPQSYLDWLGVQQDVLFFVADSFVRAECNFDFRLYPEVCKGKRIPDNWANYDMTVNNRSILDPAVVEVLPGSVIRLRTLHAGAIALWRISWPEELGKGEVVAVDGTDVERGVFVDSIPLANAQRMDVLLKIPVSAEKGWYEIVADRITGYYAEGTEAAERTGMILKTHGPHRGDPIQSKFEGKLKGWMDLDLDKRLKAKFPLPSKPVTREHVLRLTGEFTDDYGPQFSLNDARWYNFPGRGWVNRKEGTLTYKRIVQSNIPCEALCEKKNWRGGSRCDPEWDSVPLDECAFFKASDVPPRKNSQPLKVCDGDRVELTIVNQGSPRTGGDSHPIHMHGAHFQIVAVNGTRLEDGPMRDTAFVPRWTNLTVAFDAVNNGMWLIHCHMHFHLDQGMATTVESTPPLAQQSVTEWAPVSERMQAPGVVPVKRGQPGC